MTSPKCPQCGKSAYVSYVRPGHKMVSVGFWCISCHRQVELPLSGEAAVFRMDIREFLSTHTGCYDLVLADPPWMYEAGAVDSTREVMGKYATLTTEEICALPVGNVCKKDCVLFLWSPNPKIEEGLSVMRSWGFTFRTLATWQKSKNGKQQTDLGYYFRQSGEQLLVGRKGNPRTPEWKPLQSVFSATRMEHSKKPSLSYEQIERMYPAAEKLEWNPVPLPCFLFHIRHCR